MQHFLGKTQPREKKNATFLARSKNARCNIFQKKTGKKKNAARGRRMKVQSICGKCNSFVKNAVGRKTAKTGEKDNLFRKNVTYLKKKQHRFEKAQHMRNKCNMFVKLQKTAHHKGTGWHLEQTYLEKIPHIWKRNKKYAEKCNVFGRNATYL